jgi:hypothetical protein
MLKERFAPYFTLLASLLAAMLAASIYSIQDGEILKVGILKVRTLQIPRTEGWKATFLAGSRLGVAGKMNNKVVSKAQLKRLLRKLLALYKRDLLLLPTKHLDLGEHLIKHLFEQVELKHLKSYKIIKS